MNILYNVHKVFENDLSTVALSYSSRSIKICKVGSRKIDLDLINILDGSK